MNVEKITKIISGILGVLGIVFLFLVISKSDENIKMDASLGDYSSVSPMVNLTVAIVIITIFVTLIFSLRGLLSDSKKLKKASISIGSLLLVVAISFLMSTGVETPLKDDQVLSAAGSRWVETGIRTGYVLASIAILSMIFSSIKKIIKG